MADVEVLKERKAFIANKGVGVISGEQTSDSMEVSSK